MTCEPACNGSHGAGGSITGAREVPEQVGDQVVLLVLEFLLAVQRSGELCLLSGHFAFKLIGGSSSHEKSRTRFLGGGLSGHECHASG